MLAIEGDPNGLFWDDAASVLYVADDDGNRILRWTDARGFELAAALPQGGSGLGQVVRGHDGSLVVTRFGHGKSGDVVRVASSGESAIVPGLDPTRRRIGLTVAAGSGFFDAWFVRLETGERVGAVGRLSLDGVEDELIVGLKKPVGVLAIDRELFVSDQDTGRILKASIEDPSSYGVFAALEGPDLLAAGPDRSLFTGGAGGKLYRIEADGAVKRLASGFRQVRGVAYDGTQRRLFVADHDADASDGLHHALHVLPVD